MQMMVHPFVPGVNRRPHVYISIATYMALSAMLNLCYNRNVSPKRRPQLSIPGEHAASMASEHTLPAATATEYPPFTSYDENTVVMAPRRRKRRWVRALLLVVVLFLLLAGIAGAAAYQNPSLLLPLGDAFLGRQSGTVAWNGTDPLNILVMGIDQRTTEQTRSDTIIVLHLDPATRQVEMLSVPRDMWVTIPSADRNNPFGLYKINAAYALGQNYGQAPQFAQLTVESVLHIPINYYAVLKFTGFKSIVDALGGVTVCVPHELNDPTYPADVGYGYHPIDIKAGCQHMDGTVALEYARERHAVPQEDLGRNQQQQALLAGMEQKLLSPGTLLHLPALLSAANGAFITDIPHGILPEVGLLLGRAKGKGTTHAYINVDGGYVTQGVSLDGQDILQPNWPLIQGLIARMFPQTPLRAENATVQVRNGQHTAGLAALYSTVLQGMGFNTIAPQDADKNTYGRNLVIVNQDRPGADYTARLLTQMLQADVSYRHIGADHPQIVVILGSSAAEGT